MKLEQAIPPVPPLEHADIKTMKRPLLPPPLSTDVMAQVPGT